MLKLGVLFAVVGLLCVIGAVGRAVYSLATAFTAATTDPGNSSAAAPSFSLSTPLTIITAGVILIVAGVVVVLASNRSDPRV